MLFCFVAPNRFYNPNEVAIRFSCHIHIPVYIYSRYRDSSPALHCLGVWPIPEAINSISRCYLGPNPSVSFYYFMSEYLSLSEQSLSPSLPLSLSLGLSAVPYVYFIFHNVVGCVRVRKIIYKIHTQMEQTQFYIVWYSIVWYNKCRNEKPARNGGGGNCGSCTGGQGVASYKFSCQ